MENIEEKVREQTAWQWADDFCCVVLFVLGIVCTVGGEAMAVVFGIVTILFAFFGLFATVNYERRWLFYFWAGLGGLWLFGGLTLIVLLATSSFNVINFLGVLMVMCWAPLLFLVCYKKVYPEAG